MKTRLQRILAISTLASFLAGVQLATAQQPLIYFYGTASGGEVYQSPTDFYPQVRQVFAPSLGQDVTLQALSSAPLVYSGSVVNGYYSLTADLPGNQLRLQAVAPTYTYLSYFDVSGNLQEYGIDGGSQDYIRYYNDQITVYGPFPAGASALVTVRARLEGTLQAGPAGQGYQGKVRKQWVGNPLGDVQAKASVTASLASGGSGGYTRTAPSSGAPSGGGPETVGFTAEYTYTAVAAVAGQMPPFNYPGANVGIYLDNGASADVRVSFEIVLPRGYSASSLFMGDQLHTVYANAQPSFTDAGDVTGANTGPFTLPDWATDINPGALDEANQVLSFVVTANSNPNLFSAGPAIRPDGTLTFTPVPGSVGSAQLTVVLRDDGGLTAGGLDTSVPHTFTINLTGVDLPPTVTSAQAESPYQVLVQWSEPVAAQSATTPANYVLGGGLSVSSATLLNPTTVRLSTSGQAESTTYTLRIQGVQDTTGNAGQVDTLFRSLQYVPGQVRLRTWPDDAGVFSAFASEKIADRPPTRDETRPGYFSGEGLGDVYFGQLRGWFTPEVAGNYVFLCASDDDAELYLSTDDNPANRQKIASVPGWTGTREWNKYPEQRSASIPLQAGQRYYLELVWRDGTSGDHGDVAVKQATGADPVNGTGELGGDRVGSYVSSGFPANQPPVANAGGPYTINQGANLVLDASGSTDPDLATGDTIVSYAWDLNNDGTFGDVMGMVMSVTPSQLTALGLGAGSHTISLHVTDSYGTTGTATTTLEVRSALAITSSASSLMVNEGDTASNDGTFSPGNGTRHVMLSASLGTVIQDDDAGTWTWSYTAPNGPASFTVFVTADDGVPPPRMTSFTLDVYNVPASFELGPDEVLDPGSNGNFARNGIPIIDPGADIWSIYVNYGDGTPTQQVYPNPFDRTFSLAHSYLAAGTYTVTGDISDGETGDFTDTFIVTVDPNTAPVATFNFADFNSNGGLALFNAAATGSGILQLTAASPSQNGTAIYTSSVSLRDGFDTEFQFRISSPSGVADTDGAPGGDGFALVIQGQGPSSTGPTVGYIPYSVPDAIALEFDTWRNGNLDDPDGNHLSVQSVGPSPDGYSEFDHSRSLGWATPGFNLSDGAVHTAHVKYRPGQLEVFLDGATAPALVVPVDLSNIGGRSSLRADGTGWLSLAAGTGAAYEAHEILSWSFQPFAVTPNQSPVANPGGPYTLDQGNPLLLDGSASSDPDPGDTITSYSWDLNDDGTFGDATGATPAVTPAQLAALGVGPGPHTIHLRVTDSVGASHTASTSLFIRGTQTISFDPIGNHTYGDAPFTISATASSGLPVTLTSLTPSVAAVSGNTVTILGAGTATIRASQAGSANYLAATDVDQSFTVAKATPVIAWSNPADLTLGTALSGTQLNATANVPGTFTYDPPAGTVLYSGDGQVLTAAFTPIGSSNYRSVSATRTIRIVLDRPAEVWSWGYNHSGQLGNGRQGYAAAPVAVSVPLAWSGRSVVHVAAGYNHSLAVLDDGSLWAWGVNASGQLGNGQQQSALVPVAVIAPPGWSGRSVVGIAAGSEHSLALLDDGSVWAWGRGDSGQLGNDQYNYSPVPVAISRPVAWSGRTVVSVAAGSMHCMALLDDGSLWTWGLGYQGQLGNGGFVPSAVPVPVAAPPAWNGHKVVNMGASAVHSLAVLDDGSAWAWGSGQDGRLGDGQNSSSAVPVAVSAPPTWNGRSVVAVTCGQFHSLALLDDGTVWVWGGGATAVPTAVSAPAAWNGHRVTKVIACNYNSVAVLDDGSVWAWGPGDRGQLGNGQTVNSSVPVLVSAPLAWNGHAVVNIAAGDTHSLALLDDGTVWSWGGGGGGQLGIGSNYLSALPATVSSPAAWNGHRVVTVAGSHDHGLAVLDDSSVWAWGNGREGQLGNGQTGDSAVPIAVSAPAAWNGLRVVSVATGYNHSLALLDDGSVWAWGEGPLGNAETSRSLVPVAVSAPAVWDGHRVLSVAAGHGHNLAVLDDGSVWAWGNGWEGQLGNGQTSYSTLPVAVSAPLAWTGHGVLSVAAGNSHSLAVLDDGSAWAWGSGNSGQLGNGQFGQSAAPVPVSAPATWNGHSVMRVAAGYSHSLALLNDGTAWAWGEGYGGKLGNGQTAHATLPVAVSAPATWNGRSVVGVAAGGGHSLAVLNDGSVWAWGSGSLGQLGIGQPVDSSVPLAVLAPEAWSGRSVVQVVAGNNHTIVLVQEPGVAPMVANPIPSQNATYGAAFSFTVPANTFTDPDAGQTLSYSASGLPAWLTFDASTRTFSGTPPALGSSTITVTATDSGTPALSASTTFDLVVGKAALTATGDRLHRFYGEANPPLTGVLAGVVNGDNITASYSTGAAPSSPAGAWTIFVTLHDPDSRLGNYEVTNINGVLYVDPAPQTITFGAIPAHVYGDAPFTVPVSASSGLPVTLTSSAAFVGTVSGNTLTITGAGTTLLTAYQAGDGNYQAATFVQTSYSVGKATPVITWATPAPITSSTPLSATELNATANTPGTFNYSPAAGTTLARGAHPLSVEFTPSNPANYTTASATVSLTVVNSAPVATAQSVTTPEDTALAITVTGTDADAEALTLAVVSAPVRGTLSGTAPNLTYTPWPHYHGPDQFTFQASDGTATASATVAITVTPVNDAPQANSTAVTTVEDTAAPVRLSAADVEAGGYAVLQVFGGDPGAGRSPSGGLIEGEAQMLYGTTELGGAGDNGTVFRVNPDGSGYTVLHSFAANGSEGAWPRARLVAGPGGVLYGTTASRGNSSAGTVWKLNPDGSGFTVLLHKAGFPGSSTGLLLGSDGALYGTTVFGGASGNGTVFTVSTTGTGYTVLHSFSGLANEGGRPYAQLVEDADGVLYGTTEVGGANPVNGGTVFKLQKNGTGFTVLQAFTGGTGNAGTLRRGLLLASDGALYGVTPTGGQNSKGTVFKVQRDGTGFQLLHQFAANGAQGGSPQAALVEDAEGVLYGATTSSGAFGGGTVFRLNLDGSAFGVLHHFRSGTADGNPAQGELALGSSGWLYGTTLNGTATSGGALFMLARRTTGLDFTLLSYPTHGTLSGTPPDLIYTPAANYSGSDGFAFQANDGIVDSGPATVSITVTPVNDAPTAHAGGPYLINLGASLLLDGSQSSDPDLTGGDALTFSWDVNDDGTFGDATGVAPTVTPAGLVALGVGPGVHPIHLRVADPQGAVNTASTALTIAATQALSFNPIANHAYGEAPFTIYATASSGLPVTFTSLTPSVVTVSGTTVTLVGTGTATIRASQPGSGGFLPAADVDQSFTITKGDPHLRWDYAPPAITYGTPLPEAFLSGATADVPGTFVYSPAPGAVLPVSVPPAAPILGTVGFTPTDAANYAADSRQVPILVFPAPLTVTPLSVSRPYGAPNPELTGTVVGSVNGDLITALFETTADVNSPVGTYPITATLQAPIGVVQNYAVTLNPGTLTVVPDNAPVVTLSKADFSVGENVGAVVIDDQAVVSDVDSPNLDGATLTVGFANGDGTADDRLALRNEGTDPGQIGVDGGDVTFGGALIGAFTGGADGVTPLVVTFNALATPAVAQAVARNVTFQNLSSTPVAQARIVRFTLTDGDGGLSAPAELSLLIVGVPESPVIAWAESAPIVEGTPLSADQLNATASAPGDFTYDPTVGTVLPPGSHTLTAWFTPMDRINYNLASATRILTVNPAVPNMPVVTGISPSTAPAYGPAFTLTLNGSGFTSGGVALWNASPRPTTFVNPGQLAVQIPDTDLQVPGDLTTVLITVRNGAGPESAPLVFTITGSAVGTAHSVFVPAGQIAVVGELPATPGSAAVVAGVNNAGDPAPITVTAARYTGNPTSVNVIDVDGGFVDLRVTGADVDDVALAQFYYASTVSAVDEPALRLRYFDGTRWADVKNGAGTDPVKDTTDDLDGSVSGGRFAVTFDGTSTPRITELGGTVFVATVPETAGVTWPTPADIGYGTPLGAGQLNATAQVPGTFTYTPSVGTVLNAGNNQVLSVTFTPTDSANYAPVTLTVGIKVAKAPLTIAADIKSKAYGAALPALTLSYTGFVNGDTSAKLTTPPMPATTALKSSPVADYPITVTGATAANYDITMVPATLTVTPVPLKITAVNKSKIYGNAIPALTATYSGFVNGDGAASLDVPVKLTTAAVTNSPVGTYVIEAGGAADANYVISFVNGTLTVTPRALKITAQNKSKNYGAALPTLTAAYSGLAPGETAADLDVPPTLATTASPASNVGTYPITLSEAADPNYTITMVNGTLTINPAALTVRAVAKSKTYGAAVPALTYTTTGLVNGDTEASLDTPVTILTDATASSPVGTYPIVVGGASDANYRVTFANANLTVTKAPLTIKAQNATKVYGAALPSLPVIYTGFVPGENESVLTTPANVTTTATESSNAGNYPITVSGATAANYSITLSGGTLSVTKAPLTITADNKTKKQGTANPAFTASYAGFVNGDTVASLDTAVAFSTTATTTSPVGTYPITPKNAKDINYTVTFVNGTLAVTP